MPNFAYKAKSANGEEVRGLVEAKDTKQAVSALRSKGLYTFFLREKHPTIFDDMYTKIFRRVTLVQLANFTRQMATMMNAGLPLTEALVVLKTQGSERLGEIVEDILKSVESGNTLADALGRHTDVFSPVYIALVRAGEMAGVLDQILLRLADNLESQREFMAKVKGALTYPVIIVVGMGLVMAVMMILVVPKLLGMYKEFGAKMPQATLILMRISDFFVQKWWLILVIIIGAINIYRLINKSPAGKKKIDGLKLRIPIAGKLQKKVVLTEFTRTLGLLIGAGVNLVEGLEISSRVTNNLVINEAVESVNRLVEKGYPLASAMGQFPVFPAVLSQMLAVGEETGKLDEILLKVSKFYQSESEEALKGLTSALEPLIMVVLGIAVCFLVIAVIMPIYGLTNEIK